MQYLISNNNKMNWLFCTFPLAVSSILKYLAGKQAETGMRCSCDVSCSFLNKGNQANPTVAKEDQKTLLCRLYTAHLMATLTYEGQWNDNGKPFVNQSIHFYMKHIAVGNGYNVQKLNVILLKIPGVSRASFFLALAFAFMSQVT